MDAGKANPKTRCWNRRDLLKLPIPICALAAAGGAASVSAAATKRDEKAEGEKRLCTYCGLYCGLCELFLGVVSEHAGELQRMIKFFGLNAEILNEDAETYGAFARVLEALKLRVTGVQPCGEGCDLYPVCKIRPCAKERGVETCAFCDDFPCSIISPVMEKFGTTEALHRQKELGLQAWADEQAALAAAGRTYAGKS